MIHTASRNETRTFLMWACTWVMQISNLLAWSLPRSLTTWSPKPPKFKYWTTVCVWVCVGGGCDACVCARTRMHTSGPSTHSSGTVVLVAIATAGNSCLGKRFYSQCRTVIMMKAIPDCYKLHYTEQSLSYQEHNNNDIVRVGNLIVM